MDRVGLIENRGSNPRIDACRRFAVTRRLGARRKDRPAASMPERIADAERATSLEAVDFKLPLLA